MKVLVVGSAGQLGQDLMRVFGEDATGLTHQDLDITDGVSVLKAISVLRPDWVLNTAAFHRVDDCEVNPILAFEVNALGALNVARAAAMVNAGVVFFSTDYVFGADEERRYPYIEEDCPQPLNVYGISKFSGEQLIIQANPRHCIVRSSGLYGTATSGKGWTFAELMLRRARSEGRVRVVTDQVLSPTYTWDLAGKVKELVDQDAGGIFHVVNAGECSWFTFARNVLTLAGVSGEIEPINTMQTQRRARRPCYSALRSVRLERLGLAALRPWEDALWEYLRAKGVI
jgi:dTDP-4-dehydrorhamnose reductase